MRAIREPRRADTTSWNCAAAGRGEPQKSEPDKTESTGCDMGARLKSNVDWVAGWGGRPRPQPTPWSAFSLLNPGLSLYWSSAGWVTRGSALPAPDWPTLTRISPAI